MIPAPHFYACYDMVRMSPMGVLVIEGSQSPFVWVIRTLVLRGNDGEPLRWDASDPDHEQRMKTVNASLDRLLVDLGKICPSVGWPLGEQAFAESAEAGRKEAFFNSRFIFRPGHSL